MAYLTEPLVQNWLEQTKLDVVSVEPQLELTAKSVVLGRLKDVYDTSSWLDTASTPELVVQVMAMYYAAWFYRRQYSEDTDQTPNYADWLEGLADSLLASIVDGSVDLPGFPPLEGTDANGSPDFYPKDNNYDDTGVRVDDAVFSMGMKF